MAADFKTFFSGEAFSIFKVGEEHFINPFLINGIVAKIGLVGNPTLLLMFYGSEVAFDEVMGIGP
jgi:hypothetical protein